MTISEMMNTKNLMQGNNPMALQSWARSLFDHERWLATVNDLLARLHGRCQRLHLLRQAGTNAHYLGTQTVALEQIHGSESRSDDFDSSFHPLSYRTLNRWMSVAIARQKGVTLPPIELIKVGDEYFVRDGHHRVSVAHAFGEHFIEAEVIEW